MDVVLERAGMEESRHGVHVVVIHVRCARGPLSRAGISEFALERGPRDPMNREAAVLRSVGDLKEVE